MYQREKEKIYFISSYLAEKIPNFHQTQRIKIPVIINVTRERKMLQCDAKFTSIVDVYRIWYNSAMQSKTQEMLYI